MRCSGLGRGFDFDFDLDFDFEILATDTEGVNQNDYLSPSVPRRIYFHAEVSFTRGRNT
jgi:hypothetical protein